MSNKRKKLIVILSSKEQYTYIGLVYIFWRLRRVVGTYSYIRIEQTLT